MKRSFLLSLGLSATAMVCASQLFAHQLTIHNDSRETLNVDAVTYQSQYQKPFDVDDFDDDAFDIMPISNFLMPFDVKSDSAIVQLDINYHHSALPNLHMPICVIELGDFNQNTGTFQTVIENSKISLNHSCTYNAATGTVSVH